MNTRGRSGKLSKSVNVETNDPTEPNKRLTVSALVEVEVDLEKRYVYVRTLDQGAKHSERIPILAKDPASLEITDITSAIPGVSGRVVKETTAEGKPRHVLEVTIDAKEVGRLNGTLDMTTNHPKAPKLSLRISGEVVGNIRATPRQAYLRTPEAGKPPKSGGSKVRVSAARGTFRVRKAEDPTGRVLAEVKEIKPGAEYELQLTLGPKAGDKYFKAELTIFTDSKEQPTLVVPVSFRPKLGGAGGKPGRALGSGRKPGLGLRPGGASLRPPHGGSGLSPKPGGTSRPTLLKAGVPGAQRIPQLPRKGPLSTTGGAPAPATSTTAQ